MASSHRDLTRDQPRVAPGWHLVGWESQRQSIWIQHGKCPRSLSSRSGEMHHWFFVASPGSPGSLGAPMNIEVYWSQYQPIYVKLSQSQYIVIYNLYIYIIYMYSICQYVIIYGLFSWDVSLWVAAKVFEWPFGILALAAEVVGSCTTADEFHSQTENLLQRERLTSNDPPGGGGYRWWGLGKSWQNNFEHI